MRSLKHQDDKSLNTEAGRRGVVRLDQWVGGSSWDQTKKSQEHQGQWCPWHSVQRVLIGDLKKTTEPKFICKREILIPFPPRLLSRAAVSIIHRTVCDYAFKTRARFAEGEEKTCMK